MSYNIFLIGSKILINKNKNYNYLFLVLLFLILSLSNGASNIFNGLPWINKYETIVIFIILPIILLINFDILKNLILRILIIILIILKLILIWAPEVGIGHKIYYTSSAKLAGADEFRHNQFLKTYSNF